MVRNIIFCHNKVQKCEAFRRKNVANGVTINFCCPKGFYLHKEKQCKTQLMIQSVSFDSNIFNTVDAERWLKQYQVF